MKKKQIQIFERCIWFLNLQTIFIKHFKIRGRKSHRSFLFQRRGFTETIEKFSLGYSPDTWDAFTKEALGKGYKLEFLEKV
jgi:DNA primase